MLTYSENTGTPVKAGFASQGLSRIEQVFGDTELVAHLKVIAPLTSTGPSVRARVVRDSIEMLIIRSPHMVLAGALVQIRIANKVLFGKAGRCTAAGAEYEIEIEKQEIY